MLPDKYIGLILAVSSSFFIGFSFTLTKRGLMLTKKRHGKHLRLLFLSPMNGKVVVEDK
jgi:hypothetical protein